MKEGAIEGSTTKGAQTGTCSGSYKFSPAIMCTVDPTHSSDEIERAERYLLIQSCSKSVPIQVRRGAFAQQKAVVGRSECFFRSGRIS